MAGPAVAMALEEPMNRPAPIMPAMEIIETWRVVRPCLSERCPRLLLFELMHQPSVQQPPGSQVRSG